MIETNNTLVLPFEQQDEAATLTENTYYLLVTQVNYCVTMVNMLHEDMQKMTTPPPNDSILEKIISIQETQTETQKELVAAVNTLAKFGLVGMIAHKETAMRTAIGSQNDEPMTRYAQARKATSKRTNGSSNLDPFAVRKYRKNHTVPETARQFGVSESTIKRTLKSGK